MVDTVKETIKKARKNLVLVWDKGKGRGVKNPDLEDLKWFKKELRPGIKESLIDPMLFKKFQYRYNIYPDETKEWEYVLQSHIRGKSLHIDYRASLSNSEGIGFTITVPFGLEEEQYKKMEDIVKKVEEEELDKPAYHNKNGEKRKESEIKDRYNEINQEKLDTIQKKVREEWSDYWEDELKSWFMDKWKEDYLNWTQKHVVIEKSTVPISWFDIEQEALAPGVVGSSEYTWGSMFQIDKGRVQFGGLKADYVEHFLTNGDIFRGKMNFIKRPHDQIAKTLTKEQEKRLGDSEYVWLHFTSKNQDPYMLEEDGALEKEWLPDEGISAIPEEIRKEVPDEAKYWQEEKGTASLEKAVEWYGKNWKGYSREGPKDVPSDGEIWTREGD